MSLIDLLYYVARLIEVMGVVAIVVGIAIVAVNFIRIAIPEARTISLRSTLGRAILLSLKLLIAAGISNTVAIESTRQSLAGLLACSH